MDRVADTLDAARRQADRVLTPETRQRAYDSVHAFAVQRPLLFVSVNEKKKRCLCQWPMADPSKICNPH